MTLYERRLLVALSVSALVLLSINSYLHFKNQVHLKLVPAQSVNLPADEAPAS